ncbi:prostaglandin G/H synthase 2-like [Branchiostoma lanceolatum]|uniref:prostaglandin G/H synthase 2-like n=1 Tax=Branchiostoma lanceolatum TaxID=7740 RepID=UPI00345423C3
MNGAMMTICLMLLPALIVAENPCCSMPCQNTGVCMREGDSYSCDCTRTGYYGQNCDIPEFWTSIKVALKPSKKTTHHLLTNYKWLWNIVNRIPFLSNFIMRAVYKIRSATVDSPPVYHTGHDYTSWDTYADRSYYARALPPVPPGCPTPMGTAGRKELPSPEYIAETFLARRRFIPDRRRTNVLFNFMAQHFTHQFFKTDFKKGAGRTWGDHGVDLSHIYGETVERQHQLRAFTDGKLKFQRVGGEVYPPSLADAPVHMIYPPYVPAEKRFAIGHEFFGLLPGLFVYSTVWLREHNRVCDVMKELHPDWDDERLFQTARLILTGETINIIINEYVQHLSGYNFDLFWDPELLFKDQFQYQNRIFVEFNHLYHWHPLMPDQFHVNGTTYGMKDYLFNSDLVFKHGFGATVDAMSRQIAGQIGPKNIGPVNLKVAVETIKHERNLRMQGLNQYRKRFGIPPYKTFLELTGGDAEMAAQLEEAYGDVDAVELYVGLMIEQPAPGSVTSETIIELGGPFSVKGLLSNPLCSPQWWRPSTFGGEAGFRLVKTATLRDLFCRNMDGPCGLVTFAVPEDVTPTGLPQEEGEGGAAQDKQTSQNDADLVPVNGVLSSQDKRQPKEEDASQDGFQDAKTSNQVKPQPEETAREKLTAKNEEAPKNEVSPKNGASQEKDSQSGSQKNGAPSKNDVPKNGAPSKNDVPKNGAPSKNDLPTAFPKNGAAPRTYVNRTSCKQCDRIEL